jgi:hypothetical protein
MIRRAFDPRGSTIGTWPQRHCYRHPWCNLQTTTPDLPIRHNPAHQGIVRWWRRSVVVAAALAGLATPLFGSEPNTQDLRLIAQCMGFLLHPPTGTLEIGIVYPTGSAAGKAEAEQIEAAFGTGLQGGSLTLRPRLLTLEEAARQEHAGVLLLTSAALPRAGALAAATAGKGILTVTSDPVAIAAGEAVMAVRSQPRVEIFVSRAAALAAGVEFSTAFRMMIQER